MKPLSNCLLQVYLPYAKDLALTDRFDEARLAYARAGRPELSSQMLQQLCHNAVLESRFQDASYYFWTLASEVRAREFGVRLKGNSLNILKTHRGQ